MRNSFDTGEPPPASGADLRENPVEVLTRWQDSGAIWRVVSRTPAGLTIALITCDGREEVGRLTSNDPELLSFVGDRRGNEP